VVLLALRTLILFLLTTALAEPVLQPRVGELVEIAQARAVVLIMDNTMSMAYQTAGMTSWDLAKEVSELVIQEFRPQDHGVMLPLVSTDPLPQALSGDRAGLMQQVRELAHTFQPGGFVLPFQRAYALLKTSEAPKKEIVVITDHTRTPWVGFEPATSRCSIRRSGGGDRRRTNGCSQQRDCPEVRLTSRPPSRACQAHRYRELGAIDRKQMPVRLVVDGKPRQRLLDLPKRKPRTSPSMSVSISLVTVKDDYTCQRRPAR
jgi:hypothetical protein